VHFDNTWYVLHQFAVAVRIIIQTEGSTTTTANTSSRHECYSVIAQLCKSQEVFTEASCQ